MYIPMLKPFRSKPVLPNNNTDKKGVASGLKGLLLHFMTFISFMIFVSGITNRTVIRNIFVSDQYHVHGEALVYVLKQIKS